MGIFFSFDLNLNHNMVFQNDIQLIKTGNFILLNTLSTQTFSPNITNVDGMKLSFSFVPTWNHVELLRVPCRICNSWRQ